MWFGDSVTLTEWPDIWLHEGRDVVGVDLERVQRAEVGTTGSRRSTTHRRRTPPSGRPAQDPGGPEFMFNGTIYNRGGMTLQALREKIGDGDFFEILKRWAAENRYGNVTTPEFIALAEQVSGENLGEFFNVWLYQREKPTSW